MPTNKQVVITKAEMKNLGIDGPADHSDVHIPVNEFINKFEKNNE